MRQNTCVAKPTEAIPADRTSSLKPQDGHERRVLNYTARLAQANEQLRREIKERQYAEERLLEEQQNLCHLLELRDRDQQVVSIGLDDGVVRRFVAAIMQLRTFSRLARRA